MNNTFQHISSQNGILKIQLFRYHTTIFYPGDRLETCQTGDFTSRRGRIAPFFIVFFNIFNTSVLLTPGRYNGGQLYITPLKA